MKTKSERSAIFGALVSQAMKASPGLSYADAYSVVMSQNPELANAMQTSAGRSEPLANAKTVPTPVLTSDSDRDRQWQKLVAAEMNADPKCSYQEAWNRAGATKEGKAILAEMTRCSSNLVGRSPAKVVALGRASKSANANAGSTTTAMNTAKTPDPNSVTKTYPAGFAGGPQITALRAAGTKI